MGMLEKVRGEESKGRALWRRCRKTGMDTATEEMRDGNIRDVVRRRWRNGLKEWRQTGQIPKRKNYQPEGVSSPQ